MLLKYFGFLNWVDTCIHDIDTIICAQHTHATAEPDSVGADGETIQGARDERVTLFLVHVRDPTTKALQNMEVKEQLLQAMRSTRTSHKQRYTSMRAHLPHTTQIRATNECTGR